MRSRSYAQKIHSPFAATQILHLLNNTRKVRVCIFINTTLILLKRCYKIYVAKILYHLCWQKSSIFLLLCKKFTLQSPCMKVKKFCCLWFDARPYRLCLSFLLTLGRCGLSTLRIKPLLHVICFKAPHSGITEKSTQKKAVIFR